MATAQRSREPRSPYSPQKQFQSPHMYDPSQAPNTWQPQPQTFPMLTRLQQQQPPPTSQSMYPQVMQPILPGMAYPSPPSPLPLQTTTTTTATTSASPLPIEMLTTQMAFRPPLGTTQSTILEPIKPPVYSQGPVVRCYPAACSLSFMFTFVPQQLLGRPAQYTTSEQSRHVIHDSLVCSTNSTTVDMLVKPKFMPSNILGGRAIIPTRITIESVENSSPWPFLFFADWCPTTNPHCTSNGVQSLARIPPSGSCATKQSKCVYDIAATPETKILCNAMQSPAFIPILGFDSVASIVAEQIPLPKLNTIVPAVSTTASGGAKQILCDSTLGLFIHGYLATISEATFKYETATNEHGLKVILLDDLSLSNVCARLEQYIQLFSKCSIKLTPNPTCFIDFDIINPDTQGASKDDPVIIQAFGQFPQLYGQEGASFLLNTPYTVSVTLNLEYLFPCHSSGQR